MALLLGPGRVSVCRAAIPEETLSVTLTPTRGDLVRVTVEDLRAAPAGQPPGAGLFPRPLRALGLVPMSRVELLVEDLQSSFSAGPIPAAFAEGDLVLRATLPLADGAVDVHLREDEGAPQLPLARRLIDDFAMQVLALPETRMTSLDPRDHIAHRARAILLRVLLILALIGTGGYLVGSSLQRLLGCAP